MPTYYIDPVNGLSGNAGTSEGAPKADWEQVKSLVALGDSVLYKRGTTSTVPMNGGWTGSGTTEANRITFGAYGSGANPVIDVQSNAPACIEFSNKNYVTVQDFEVTGAIQDGCRALDNVTRACSHITFQRLTAHDNGISGISFTVSSTEAPAAGTNGLIENCTAYNNGGHGIGIQAYRDGDIIRRCTAWNNSLVSSGWNLYMAGSAYTFDDDPGWSSLGGGVYARTLTKTVIAVWENGAPMVAGAFGALTANQWAYSGTTLQIYPVSDPVGRRIVVFYNYCDNGIIEFCEAYECGPAHDGVGIGFDRAARWGTIRRSYSHDNPGDDFQTNNCEGTLVESCVSKNAGRYGIRIATPSVSGGAWHCSVQNPAIAGVSTVRVYAASAMLAYSNIVEGGQYGVHTEVAQAGVIDDYNNCLYGQTVAARLNVVGVDGIAVNPEIGTDKIARAAALRGSGLFIDASIRDYRGHLFLPSAVDIGPFAVSRIFGGLSARAQTRESA